jgi:hypothetical protein
MDFRDFSSVLASWTRLDVGYVRFVMSELRRAGLVPHQRGPVTFAGAARALTGLLAAGAEGRTGLAARARETCSLALEGPRDADPLDTLPRAPFSRLVGATLGQRSRNGYVDFSEALAAAMSRLRENLGGTVLERVSLRIGGTDPVGLIEARDGDGLYVFPFTRGGEIVPRTGLVREVSIDRATLHGVAFLMDAEGASAR